MSKASTAAPLFGLILAGGTSSRMRSDKAALVYDGVLQLERAATLLRPHVMQMFVSVRQNQAHDPARVGHAQIIDAVEGDGPIVGIRSALAAYPHAAWLVLACDLPFLTASTLSQLIDARNPQLLVTAYRSAHDGLPEPLCAIWEPQAAAALATFQAGGKSCPRKFILRHAAQLLDLDDRRALDNINTPDEYADARRSVEHGKADPMQLKIQYFAVLREQAGRSEETLETAAATPAALFEELRTRYGFTLPREALKVAVNSEFTAWSRQLAAGDSVVFIPPVAGG